MKKAPAISPLRPISKINAIYFVTGGEIRSKLDSMDLVQDAFVLALQDEEAEPLLLGAVEGRRLKLGDTHPHTLESWHNLIELYEAWNKPEKAEEWRTKLPQTEAVDE
jgi:hypothetical protein